MAGIFVRRGTPTAIVVQLRRVFMDYFQSDDYAKYLHDNGNFMEPMRRSRFQCSK